MDQLRSRERLIWGLVGEEVLKSSRILILGFSILTSELAISLASSGIGEIVLVDGQIATEEDYGACLSLDGEKPDVINHPKIYLLKNYLLSLQLNIRVECILESPERYLETLIKKSSNSNPLEYSIIVCCNLSGMIVENVYNMAKNCQGISSSFVISLKSRGHLGQYQVFTTNQMYITFDLSVESKNLAKLHGLQLFKPIESLMKLASEIDLNELEDGSSGLRDFLSKIPFPIILVHIGLNVGLFKKSEFDVSRGNLKKKFEESLEKVLKNYDFPNYIEAKRYQYLVFSDPQELLPDQMFQILESQKIYGNFNGQLSLNKRPFSIINIKYQIILGWICEFLNDFGRFPVNKELPEMYCETITYLQLQKIYNEQYTLDFSRIYNSNSGNMSISNSGFDLNISEELVQFVCRHLYCLRFIEFRNTFFRWGEIQNKARNLDPILKERLVEVFLEDCSQESQLIEFLFLDFLDYIHIDGQINKDPETIKAKFQDYLNSLSLEYIKIPTDLIQR
ncbi:ubiquitin activating enzyme E1 [Cryptosporidium sp. chipmunk genotype I]|uniref:ubiquitin activating enzyme E1 n=1 Tax=Cryptosporidium sp. chipmunk genotype I TaxID=1280935 RepID=UPI00351A61D8|nr:ubiquitin activating enzyme E1 [Cryptosporidium sp. chipmunk genotype I]